jgi:succinate dehydrogenase / fumarate reductase membrane anchor subunit
MRCFDKGLTDWYLQRGTTVFISIYFMPMIVYWVLNPYADVFEWYKFLTTMPMLAAAILGTIALSIHAYIGMWVVLTDYLSDHLGQQSGCGCMGSSRRLLTWLMGAWVYGSALVALVLVIGWGIL